MNTDVTVEVVEPGRSAARAVQAAQEVFADVERSCTRFDPTSDLMRANAAGQDWAEVPTACFLAIAEAARAHVETGGLFDPRVLTTLVRLGYDRTLPFGDGPVLLNSPVTSSPTDLPLMLADARTTAQFAAGSGRRAVEPWTPDLDGPASRVRIGDRPIDLGGIGKGLAVRWAAARLVEAGAAFLVEAGGDCALGGYGPDSIGWKVGVEDPFGGDDPVAVLQLAETACATSSLRKRSWQLDGRRVHHLIDPRTGESAQGGLRSVTVVDPDPATSEVWSKALLIAGRDAVAELAARRGLSAFWVDDEGRLGASAPLLPRLIWTVRNVE